MIHVGLGVEEQNTILCGWKKNFFKQKYVCS